MSICNNSAGYGTRSVGSPELWDIPGITNTLDHCQLLKERLRSVSTNLVAMRKFRNNTLHSATLEKDPAYLDKAIQDCRALLRALEGLKGFKEEAAAPLDRAGQLMKRLENPPPAHLKGICAAACRPQVDTDSYNQIEREFHAWEGEWGTDSAKPIMWVSGKRGAGKSFAAGQIFYQRPGSAAHFYRQEQRGKIAARQLLAQLTNSNQLDFDKCWEAFEKVELNETVLMIIDGLDEELRATDSITSILATLTTWNFQSLRLLVTSIHSPPASLQHLVQHVPITVGQSARQLIKAHLPGPEYLHDARYAAAVDKVEKQAAKDLNYVSLFFSMCGVELRDEGGAAAPTGDAGRSGTSAEKAGWLLDRMRQAQPISAVYEEHVKKCMFSMPGGLVIHTVLGLLAACGGVVSPAYLKAVLGKTEAVDAALFDLQRAGLGSREEALSNSVLFGGTAVFILLPGFLSFLRHSDMAGYGSFETDYASVGFCLLQAERELLLRRENALLCAQTISFVLRGTFVNEASGSATRPAIDSSLTDFGVTLAHDSEASLRTCSSSLCLAVRALFEGDDSAKKLAARLWRDNVVGLITDEQIDGTETKLSGLLKFGLQLDHETFAPVARLVRAPLFDCLRRLEPHTKDNSINRYRGKLAKIPCSWTRHSVGDAAEEAAALHALLEARPHLADQHTLAEMMLCMNNAGQHFEAIAAYEKFHLLCDYYGDETTGRTSLSFVETVWVQRRTLRAQQQLSAYAPAHHSLDGSCITFVIDQLARAHARLGQADEIRQLLCAYRDKRPTFAIGSLLDLLLSENPTPDAVAECETLVRSFLQDGQEVRLVNCLAQVLASKEDCNFPQAKEELECLYAISNTSCQFDQHCNYYLLRCGRQEDHVQEKADHLLKYSDDPRIWEGKKARWRLPFFLSVLVAADRSAEARDIANRIDNPKALADAVDLVAKRYEDVGELSYLVTTYEAVRPLRALGRLVSVLVPSKGAADPNKLRLAERFVQSFLTNGREPFVLSCFAQVLAKNCNFPVAMGKLKKLCATTTSDIYLNEHCNYYLIHCGGLRKHVKEKADHLLLYKDDPALWRSSQAGVALFFGVLVGAGKSEEAIKIAQRAGRTDVLAEAVGRAAQYGRDVDAVRELVEGYAIIRPLQAIERLVDLLLPRETRAEPKKQLQADRCVRKFLNGGKEPRLMSCFALVLSKSETSFEAARAELLGLAEVKPPVQLLYTCHDALLHCRGLNAARKEKADHLRQFLQEDWEGITPASLERFLSYLIAEGHYKHAKRLRSRFPNVTSRGIKQAMDAMHLPAAELQEWWNRRFRRGIGSDRTQHAKPSYTPRRGPAGGRGCGKERKNSSVDHQPRRGTALRDRRRLSKREAAAEEENEKQGRKKGQKTWNKQARK